MKNRESTTEIVTAVVEKMAEYMVEPSERHVGYLFFYNRNVTELKKQVESLEDTKLRVQRCVDEATRKGDEIHEDIKKWLTSVDKIKEEADKLKDVKKSTDEDACQKVADKSCSYWSCLNLKSRYQRSRKAYKTTQLVRDLESKGLSFGGIVSYHVSPQGIGTEAVKGYEVFDSRKSTLIGVIEALKSDNINKVGVYGMGGVGKTMLVKEVARQAMEDKLFDKVVIPVVSQTPNVEEIQDKIAHVLELKFDVESTRVEQLRERLKREKSMLVIIDDIWEELDLETVGISFGDGQKGCKLLFTSRSEDVLRNDMGCQEVFNLGVLSNDEARYLFWKIVVGLPEDIKFYSVADDVVKECAGLPIAITTVANALKNKGLPVWKNALHQLRTSNPTNIKGVFEKVYPSIELSYNFLRSEEEKSLFLLCSLFGKDSEIPFELLLRYGMGLDLFRDVYHLEDARDRVHTVVENLKSSSLLLNGDEDDTFKMHDVIRDVAIHIAGKAEHMFSVGNDDLLEWLKWKKLEDTIAISFPFADVCELPERLECPRLKLFLLFNKNHSLQIPHLFFDGTKELRVLHLIGVDSQYHLSSLSFLQNLQTLRLNGCLLENVAFIGELKNLKVLDLSRSDFKELPKEIRQLTHLQVLDLSHCSKLKIIPANVLSNLERLEELYMENSFTNWEVEGKSTRESNVRVTELDYLSHLTTLKMDIPSMKILPKALNIFEKLIRYQISIDNNCWSTFENFKSSRKLKLKLDISFQSIDAIKILLKNCEDLCLGELKGVQNILFDLNSDGFLWLKHLQIQNNPDIRYIINLLGLPHISFPVLESFSLREMINLEKISHGQLTMGSFRNLRRVTMEHCDNLKYVFSSSMVECFPQLQEMVICDCKVMGAIVVMEREDEIEISMTDIIEFTQLRSLTLKDLPRLMCFCSDIDSHTLFNKKVLFPKLEDLTLRSIHSIEKKWHDQLLLLSYCFQNLTTLALGSDSLKYLSSSPMRESLLQLKRLKIYECKVMEEILAPKESSEEIRMDKLESLILQDLPKLTRFCFGNLIEFLSLKALEITKCPELKSFISNSSSTSFTVNTEVEEMNNDSAIQYLFNEKVLVPFLEKLCLRELDNLQQICNDSHDILQNLTVLELYQCDNMGSLFSASVAKGLSKLNVLRIRSCKILKEIVAEGNSGEAATITEIVFPRVKILDFEDLPELKSFRSLSCGFKWLSLKEVIVVNCPQMSRFSSGSLSTPKLNSVQAQNGLQLWKGDLDTTIQHLYDSQDPLSIITELNINSSDQLGQILDLELRDMSFINLTSLAAVSCDEKWHDLLSKLLPRSLKLEEFEVKKCDKLKNLFPISVTREFKQLKVLKIHWCNMLEEIISETKGGTKIDKIELPQLKDLELVGLPQLEKFHSGSLTVEWPCLQSLKIESCLKMKTLTVIFPSMQTLTTMDERYGEEPAIVKVEFPELQKLHLLSLRNFEEIWQGLLPAKTFPKLSELMVDTCDKLLYVMSFNSLPSFESLEKLTVQNCGSLQEVFRLEEPNLVNPHDESSLLSKLRELVLTQLPNLVHIFSRDFAIQNLQVLKVKDCDCLKNLFSSSIARCLEQIKEVEISDCRVMEEIFVKEKVDEINETISFTQLNSIVLENLPSLQTFSSGSISFGNLKSLQVVHCNELEKLFSPSTAKNLEQLELLKLYECKKMKEVISEENGDVKDMTFPKLKCLILKHLPMLTSFCPHDISVRCDSLEVVRVKEIPEMKTFAPGIHTTPKLEAIYVTHVGKCWLGDLNATIKLLYDKNVRHGKAKQTVVAESSSKMSSVGDTAADVAQFLWDKFSDSLQESESELSAFTLISYFQKIKEDEKMKILKHICSSNVTETLNLLYDLNDLLAEFQIFANRQKQLNKSLSRLILLKKFIFMRKVKNQLTRISNRFEQAVDEAGKKGVPMVEEPKGESVQSRNFETIRHTSPEVDVSEIMEFDEHVEKVESLLLGKRDDGIGFTAIGIVGMGCVGKTALMQKIFNSPRVKEEFSEKIWICLSDILKKETDVEVKIVKCILDELGHDTDEETKTTDFGIVELLKNLDRYLSNERYLIVLDDVWHAPELFNFKYLAEKNEKCLWHWLPKDSAVIVTSRKKAVAEYMVGVGKKNLVHLQPSLSKESCWNIFDKAIRKDGRITSDHRHLAELKDEIMDKFHGLPLAAKDLAKIFRSWIEPSLDIPRLDFPNKKVKFYGLDGELVDEELVLAADVCGVPLPPVYQQPAREELESLISLVAALKDRFMKTSKDCRDACTTQRAYITQLEHTITQLEQRCAHAEGLVTFQPAQINSLTADNNMLQGTLSRVPHTDEARSETVDSSGSYMDRVAIFSPQQPGTSFDVLEEGSSGGGAFAYPAHQDDT